MRFLFLGILFLSVNFVFSQQLPISSQFMFNKFLINPAATGSSKYMELRITSRIQWMGINGAPKTQNISINKLLNNKKMGVGVSLFSDKYGPESKIGLKLTYSYIIPLKRIKSNFALGLSFTEFQYSLNFKELISISSEDPVLQSTRETTFVPDADFGIYLYNTKYAFGISANQLLEKPIQIGNIKNTDNTMIRHYYIIGAYIINLETDFDVEPSVLIKTTAVTPLQTDINVKLIYQKNYWVSFSYRTSKTLIAQIGLQYNNFIISYSYDYEFGDIRQFQSGSHEIILGYNFNQKLTSNSMLNSIRSF